MSEWFGGSVMGFGSGGLLEASSERMQSSQFRWVYQTDELGGDFLVNNGVSGHYNQWQRMQFVGGANTNGLFHTENNNSVLSWAPWDILYAGNQSYKTFTGTTRDASGNPLGNVVIKAFVTSTNIFVGQTTSDIGGYFLLPVYTTLACTLLCYEAGNPDVGGVSLNTLTPT